MRKLAMVTEDRAVADSLYRRQLKLARELEDGVGPLTAKSMVAYGSFLHDLGRSKTALKYLEQAIKVFRVSGPEYRQELSKALLFTGQTYTDLYHLRKADPLIQEAFSIQKHLNGINHPRTAIYMTEVASLAGSLGEYDRAVHFARHALDIFRKTLGKMHRYTLSTLNNLSLYLFNKGAFAEAIQLQRRVLAISKAKYGEESTETVDVLQNLATYLVHRGKLEEAESLLRKAYALYKQILPADHHLIAFPLLSLTDLYMQRKDFKQAETVARKAVEQLQIAFPTGHVYLAVAKSRLGAALARQKKYKEAAPLLKHSCEKLRAAQVADEYRKKACERLELLKKSNSR